MFGVSADFTQTVFLYLYLCICVFVFAYLLIFICVFVFVFANMLTREGKWGSPKDGSGWHSDISLCKSSHVNARRCPCALRWMTMMRTYICAFCKIQKAPSFQILPFRCLRGPRGYLVVPCVRDIEENIILRNKHKRNTRMFQGVLVGVVKKV